MRGKKGFWTAAAALSWIVAASAAADYLVMSNGAYVETKGAWKVEGPVVVFTLPNGTFSSVRAGEVDLDRSAEATAAARLEAKRAAEGGEPAPRQVVREITAETIPLASLEVLAAEVAAAAGEGEDGEGAAAGASGHRLLEVTEWQQADRPDGGTEIVGQLRNKTDSAVGQVAVRVIVYGDGEVLSSGYAFLASPALGPRRTTSFRMPLEDIYIFDDVRFELEGLEILLRAMGAGDGGGDEEGQPQP